MATSLGLFALLPMGAALPVPHLGPTSPSDKEVHCVFTMYTEGLTEDGDFEYAICTDVNDEALRYFLPRDADIGRFEPNDIVRAILTPTTTRKPITEAAGQFWAVASVLSRTALPPMPRPNSTGGPTTDVRSVLVVLMKYADEPSAVAGCTKSLFEEHAFTNSDSWTKLIYEGSHHVTEFPQDRYQWVEVTVPGSVPYDASICSGLTTMTQEFYEGAKDQGHDAKDFHNVMYLTPPGWCSKASYVQAQLTCANTIAGGSHALGSHTCSSWYYQSSPSSSHAACSSFAVAHELGHNFGYHPGSDFMTYHPGAFVD